MTNVLRNVIAIAILTINGEGGVIDFFISLFISYLFSVYSEQFARLVGELVTIKASFA